MQQASGTICANDREREVEITSSFKLFHSAPEWLRGRGGNGLRCASASTWHFFPNGYNEALSSHLERKGGAESSIDWLSNRFVG